MAEQNGQEKTEKPTGKRRRDARRKGNVFQSKEVCTVVILFGVFCMIRLLLPFIYTQVRQYFNWIMDAVAGEPGSLFTYQLFLVTVLTTLKCAMPLLLTAYVLGILSHGVQTRFNVAFKALRPKFSKLNPLKGIKRLFSLKNLMEVLKSLVKIALLMILLYSILTADLGRIKRMVGLPVMNSAILTLNMIFNLVMKVCLAFTVVAFFDFFFQRWQYEKDLKMTKQEVKDEFKQTEGNPETKGRIRRIQRQMSLSRMMQKVPEADVIIRNPTHFAVAIKYDPEKNAAPVVLAKGQDELALRIVRTGEEHGVYVIENRPLARALYASCELDREIPAEFYGAVAEVLVYIYRVSDREDMLR
ncbi:MAG: flagellar biosynthesis protein FlhB [Lachnospiraceae bacterium]|nr:flagellar biosynthesis protein FlhB [Lachnospiraceae bacterium]